MLWLILQWFSGWIWWVFLPIRKKLAVDNFSRCFPQEQPSQLRKSVGDMVTQYIFILFGKRATFAQMPDISTGGICLAGHGSAWDIVLLTLAEKHPVTIFLKEPNNPVLAMLIRYFRKKAKIEALYGRNCMDKAYQALDNGRLVLFVQDQRHNDGIDCQFFGQPCKTSAAFASMLHRSQAPLFGMWQVNQGSQVEVTVEKLEWNIPESKETAITELTQKSQDFYQQMIANKPYSWLWLHDRWKII
jgi:lauroyl/myristoyl acyltransferase